MVLFIEAITVFLLIGTTPPHEHRSSCHVCHGRDDEVPSTSCCTANHAPSGHLDVVWVSGRYHRAVYFSSRHATLIRALTDAADQHLVSEILFSSTTAASPVSDVVTLTSNFDVHALHADLLRRDHAFREHHSFSGFNIWFLFGRSPTICMLFYIVGPFMVAGMSKVGLWRGAAAVWASYARYFLAASRKKGRGADRRDTNGRRRWPVVLRVKDLRLFPRDNRLKEHLVSTTRRRLDQAMGLALPFARLMISSCGPAH
jgi:hypothetical protein